MKLKAHQLKLWIITALSSFILAGILGVLLRWAFVFELPEFIQYNHIKHGHSHIAMLGWLYSGLYIFIVYSFQLYDNRFNRLFWWTQICVLGMLVSFPIQGYGPFSIIFSSAHIILSYLFCLQVFKKLKETKIRFKYSSNLFLKTALIFLVLSTFGTWFLAFLMGTGADKNALYYGAIQFYLHFQFNGWFIFGILALLLRYLEIKDLDIDGKNIKKFYRLLSFSCILTFALAITWSNPSIYIFSINSVGVIIQLLALIVLLRLFEEINIPIREHLTKWSYRLLLWAMFCLSLKIIIQSLVAIPYIATISYTIRNFVIGFIHLLMLGSISIFLLSWISNFSFKINAAGKTAFWIFFAGLILSELLLFGQGFMFWFAKGFIPYFYESLLLASVLMPIGIIYYSLAYWNAKHIEDNSSSSH